MGNERNSEEVLLNNKYIIKMPLSKTNAIKGNLAAYSIAEIEFYVPQNTKVYFSVDKGNNYLPYDNGKTSLFWANYMDNDMLRITISNGKKYHLYLVSVFVKDS